MKNWTRIFVVMTALLIIGSVISLPIGNVANASTDLDTKIAVYRDYVRSSVQLGENITVGKETSVNLIGKLGLTATAKTSDHYKAIWEPLLIVAQESNDPQYEIGEIIKMERLKAKTGYELARNGGNVLKTITGLPSGEKFVAYFQFSNNLGYSTMSEVVHFITRYPELDEIKIGSVKTEKKANGSICLETKLSDLYDRPGYVQAFYEIVAEYDCSRSYAFLDDGNITQDKLKKMGGKIIANFKPWVQGRYSVRIHIYDFANDSAGVDVTNNAWTIFDPSQMQTIGSGIQSSSSSLCQ